MSLLSAAIEGVFQLKADVSGTPAPYDDFWYGPIGASSSTGMRITADTAKRISAAFACGSIIGRVIGSLPLKPYSEGPGGVKNVALNHPLFDVLYSRPSDAQTAMEFREMLNGHLEFRGNAFAEILPGRRGAVDQLVPMHPDRVTVERMTNGRLRYKYNDPLTNQTRYLVQEEVFHLRGWSEDGVVGMSTIAAAVDTFGVALAAQDYSARFFNNDGSHGLVLTGKKFRNKDDENDFIESWQKSRTGPNRHRAAMLPAGMDVKSIGLNAADAQLLEARKFSRIEICSIFGVPPHLIGETEKTATYASVEQFNIMFAVYCIMPRLVRWEQVMQRDLFTSSHYFPKFSMAALLRGDTAARYNAYKIGIENGWLSQNDVRLLEDLNPIPGTIGDNYWRSSNWAPLSQTVNPQPAAPDATTTDDPSGNDAANAHARQLRLLALATSAAERCARKEIAALRKVEGVGAAGNFYKGHAEFLVQALRISRERANAYCDEHAYRFALHGANAIAGFEMSAAAELAQAAMEIIQ